ncbi:HU family DNA-binding protein [Alphaproteobacteria bacterium KMM 3653]|uniref:HU family DNA-binding protein n=1 Tax=Harenicola maris TaxID=2841044 RepID=A0AAP2CMP4_9RHOB|nr:HU family DNA-binding protein [Harenicola maris]
MAKKPTTAPKTASGAKPAAKTRAKAAPKASAKSTASAARKPRAAAKPKAPAKTPAKAKTPATPAVVSQATPVVAGPTIKKNELFDRIMLTTGAKKKDVKPIVEATLRALGDALSAGEELQVPPLGKVKVHRQKDLANGEMLMLKLRRTGPSTAQAPTPTPGGGADPVKDAAE